MSVFPYLIARYDSTLFLFASVNWLGYTMTSPTFASAELVFTVRPIPIFVPTNPVVTAALVSVCAPLV